MGRMLARIGSLLLVLLLWAACSSGASNDDARPDAIARDYAAIEGPTTNPTHDLPVHPDLALDLSPADAGAADGVTPE